jgi:predicted dienelactone hydrolase
VNWWCEKFMAMKKISLMLAFFLLLIVLPACVAMFTQMRLEPPKPTGKYAVGYNELTITDSSTKRVLSLDIWYPATAQSDLAREPLTFAQLNQALSKHFKLPDFLLPNGDSESQRAAPIVLGKHPILLFNHAVGSYSRQNQFNFINLASHGIMVISLGRLGESLVARNNNGELEDLDENNPLWRDWQALQQDGTAVATEVAIILAAQRTARSATDHEKASLALAQHRQYKLFEPLVRAWTQDTRFVIEFLKKASKDTILAFADTSRITVMGHSLGGVVALELGRKPILGLRAVINLDGPWVQYSQSFAALQVPSLVFASTQNLFAGQDMGLYQTFNLPLSLSRGAHLVEIEGTAHFNFTDLNQIPILGKFTPLLGSVDNQRMANLLNRGLLGFLESINQGNKPSATLFAGEAGVKETHFQ